MRRLAALAALLTMAGPEMARAALAGPSAPAGDFLVSQAPPGEMISPLALQSATISGFDEERGRKPKQDKKPRVRVPRAEQGMALGPERARILLRSLAVPGWGQATMGRRHAAALFATAEVGVWSAFTAFKIQEVLRAQNYLRTARQFAGIDLSRRDQEFRRIVGAFSSSEEYNLLVVSRDAANIFLKDVNKPDIVGYHDYIARHSLTGSDAWSWNDEDSFRRYGAQRKDAQRAGLRANTALGLAIANRLVSALHAARVAGSAQATPKHTWNFELSPGPGDDATAFRAGVRARF